MGIFSKIKDAFKKPINEKLEVKYPLAKSFPQFSLMKAQGKYKYNFPEGVIVHFTAGHQDQKGSDAINYALDHGYRYFFIDKNGDVYQQFDLKYWGSHAGESICPVTKRKNVSQYYVGIEVACGGQLFDGKTWFGKTVLPYNTRAGEIKGKYQTSKGTFEKYTQEQEDALIKLCTWLCSHGADPDLVLGHEEVAPKRKNDPGLSLSVSMDEFRLLLKQKLAEKIK
jgi:N-acetyl-anhydromuramyl-L-alanine amidase AmpD